MRGVYVLILVVHASACIRIGRLGFVHFRKGLYAYAGSGQAGLQNRVARHLNGGRERFWHIDYLLGSGVANVVRVFWKEGEKTEECHVAGVLQRRGSPVADFGSSDCHCSSHLFRITSCGFLGGFMHVLPVRCIRSVR